MSHAPSADLPTQRRSAAVAATRLEWITIGYLITCVIVVYLVMGSSQAMRVAWIEDLLSLIPPIAFLVAMRRARLPESVRHPYGHHRTIGAGHLAAAVALLAMGAVLVFDSGTGLLAGEHPPIGTLQLFGHTVWAGWLMVAAMVYTGVGPVILGRLKKPLAQALHDKVLIADAEMNKADWMTAAAAILGVLGIGLGIWWADGAAALVISFSILNDGWRQVRGSVDDLLDTEVRTVDDGQVHPVVDEILAAARALPWVSQVGVRVRDKGHVFHAEVFVVPLSEPTIEKCEALRATVRGLDWKLDDVVIAPVAALPPGVRTRPRGLEPGE
ncbi:MAG: cation transporter [Actinomycetia bacterium]|nr:cation transporter [Actinomycetes bacterium]